MTQDNPPALLSRSKTNVLTVEYIADDFGTEVTCCKEFVVSRSYFRKVEEDQCVFY